MRSYSFDMNITPKSNESPIKELVIFEEFKWSNCIMIFLIFYFFVFSLHFNFFSVLVNILILINSTHIIYKIYKIYKIKIINYQSDELGQYFSNISINNHKDFSNNFYLIIICFILGCIELILSLAINYNSIIYNQSESTNKLITKNCELFFSYMKFLFMLIKNLNLAFIYCYFKKIE